jgi:potassium-transporting ATPase KdpC subunit
MKKLLIEIRVSLIAMLSLALVVCGLYPAMVWVTAQGIFNNEANGSLIVRGSGIRGSALIAQRFNQARYFHPRPSAAGEGYNAAHSGGSNLGPLSRKAMEDISRRIRDYRTENNLSHTVRVPVDAVTASASGLDPHISPENAILQASRVALARGLPVEVMRVKILKRTEGRFLGIFGEPRVNVLLLNLDMDEG